MIRTNEAEADINGAEAELNGAEALNAADNALDLNGWVTLTNTSGASYNNAKLQLVAGVLDRERKSEADTVLLHLAPDTERQRECLFVVVRRCGLVLQLDLLHVLEYSAIEGNLHNQGVNEATTD